MNRVLNSNRKEPERMRSGSLRVMNEVLEW